VIKSKNKIIVPNNKNIIPAAKIGKIINKKQEKNAFFFTYQPKSIARICRGVIL
jgi:hypothetical protein